MASEKTMKKLQEMIDAGKHGCEIIPAFFQGRFGTSAAVSAAVRIGIKSGVLVACGKDGCGNTKYKIALPAATHVASMTLQ